MPDDKKRKKKADLGKSMKHLDLDAVHIGSSSDCTGLIPAAPASSTEKESYKELYDFEGGQ